MRGESCDFLAEGYYTAKALVELAERYSVDRPICRGVYEVLYEGRDIREGLESLFKRSLKNEF